MKQLTVLTFVLHFCLSCGTSPDNAENSAVQSGIRTPAEPGHPNSVALYFFCEDGQPCFRGAGVALGPESNVVLTAAHTVAPIFSGVVGKVTDVVAVFNVSDEQARYVEGSLLPEVQPTVLIELPFSWTLDKVNSLIGQMQSNLSAQTTVALFSNPDLAKLRFPKAMKEYGIRGLSAVRIAQTAPHKELLQSVPLNIDGITDNGSLDVRSLADPNQQVTYRTTAPVDVVDRMWLIDLLFANVQTTGEARNALLRFPIHNGDSGGPIYGIGPNGEMILYGLHTGFTVIPAQEILLERHSLPDVSANIHTANISALKDIVPGVHHWLAAVFEPYTDTQVQALSPGVIVMTAHHLRVDRAVYVDGVNLAAWIAK